MSRAGNSREAGYTLVELLAVLAIVVMIIGSVPTLVRFSSTGFALKEAGERLRSDLARLRNQARITGVPTRLIIENSGSAYRLMPDGETIRLSNNQTLRLEASDDESVSTSENEIEFMSNGTSSGGNLVLDNSKDRVILKVDWLTGSIRASGGGQDG